jgi:hypothetical protein
MRIRVCSMCIFSVRIHICEILYVSCNYLLNEMYGLLNNNKGQRGRTFHIRHREHIQAIRNNKGKSGYSNHILNREYAYRSITNIMKVIKI